VVLDLAGAEKSPRRGRYLSSFPPAALNTEPLLPPHRKARYAAAGEGRVGGPIMVRFSFILLLIFILPSGALAEKRVALVIGNGSYGHHAALPNVPNDVAAMAALFKAAKFDAVDVKYNLGVTELRRVLKEFASLAADADVATLFYAGHGIEVGQVNYLIPVDARLVTDFDIEDETVPLDRVLQAMEPTKRLRLVILDACRENPFLKSMKRTVVARSIGRGLGRVEPSTTNTLIAFATKPNAIAEDGRGQTVRSRRRWSSTS
jgi:Caspase domain